MIRIWLFFCLLALVWALLFSPKDKPLPTAKDPRHKPQEVPVSYDYQRGEFRYETDSLKKDPRDGLWKLPKEIKPLVTPNTPKASEVEGHII